MTDLARWSTPSSYESFWNDRARVAASLVGSAKGVCDEGCGPQALGQFLPANVRYLPADLVSSNPEVAICELHASKWPTLYLQCCDIVYLLGVLDCLHQPKEVLSRFARTSPELVFTYNPSDMSDYDRVGFGWVNSLTGPALLELLQECGYEIVSRTVFEHTRLVVKARSTVTSSASGWRRPMARLTLNVRNWFRR